MKSALPCVLTINGGSSSIRFAIYEAGETTRRRLDGKIDRIGSRGTNWIVNDVASKPRPPRRLALFIWQQNAPYLLTGVLLVTVALVVGWVALDGQRETKLA